MRIVVCGGGPVGVTLAACLAVHEEVQVSVLTRQPEAWSSHLRVVYRWVATLEAEVDRISSDPAEVIPDAEWVLLTVPSFARTEVLRRIQPYLSAGAWVGSFPAPSGFDWLARSILGSEQPVFGTQHIPWVTSTLRYGHSALVTGVRPEIWVGALPRHRSREVAGTLEALLQLPVRPLDNILVNALTPTNPIVHPVRLYSLFKDWKPGVTYPEPIPFYSAWDEEASRYYLNCDQEIQAACEAIPLDLHQVWPTLQHFRLERPEDLTERIRGLRPLHLIQAPLRPTPEGLIPNLESRFFTEEFPYGLLVLREVIGLAGVETPQIDELLNWGGELLGRRFLGPERDLDGLPVPQNHGLSTLDELVNHATREI